MPSIQFRPVWFADEAGAEAGFVCGPGAGDAAAEDRRADHGAFEAGFAVDMAAGHAGYFSRRVQSKDWLEIFIERAAAQVGLGTAEILSRQGKNLNRVVRRCVELLRA